MRAGQKLSQNGVPGFVGGVDGLVVGFQHQIAAVIDGVERVQKFLPIDAAVAGEKMRVMITVIVLHMKRQGRNGRTLEKILTEQGHTVFFGHFQPVDNVKMVGADGEDAGGRHEPHYSRTSALVP